MIDKSVSTLSEAIAGIHDGRPIMIGGFGPPASRLSLIDALIDQGARDLTIINNNAGNGKWSRGAAESRASTQDDLLLPAPGGFPDFSMTSIAAAKWSWSWCRRVTSRRGSGGGWRRAGGSVYPTGYGTLPLAEGEETRKSMVAMTCWNIRLKPISR